MKTTASFVLCLLLATIASAQQVTPFVIRGNKERSGFLMYPNPTVDVVYIEHIRPVTEVSVFNLLGQMIVRFETSRNHNYVLDLTELRNGMYFIRVGDNRYNTYIQKVIKE